MSEQTLLERTETGTAETFNPMGLRLDADEVVSLLVQTLREHPLIEAAFRRLRTELPRDLRYHTTEHSEDVFDAVIRLAIRDRLSEHDTLLLAVAAAHHDLGFIVQRPANEVIGASWAREAMTCAGFDEEDIQDVETAIWDTQLKMNPETKAFEQQVHGRLSPWLLDADLSNFGSTDFFKKTVLVYEEMSGRTARSVADLNDDEGRKYLASTLSLMLHHNWHSSAARRLFSAQKQRNVEILGGLLHVPEKEAC